MVSCSQLIISSSSNVLKFICQIPVVSLFSCAHKPFSFVSYRWAFHTWWPPETTSHTACCILSAWRLQGRCSPAFPRWNKPGMRQKVRALGRSRFQTKTFIHLFKDCILFDFMHWIMVIFSNLVFPETFNAFNFLVVQGSKLRFLYKTKVLFLIIQRHSPTSCLRFFFQVSAFLLEFMFWKAERCRKVRRRKWARLTKTPSSCF